MEVAANVQDLVVLIGAMDITRLNNVASRVAQFTSMLNDTAKMC